MMKRSLILSAFCSVVLAFPVPAAMAQEQTDAAAATQSLSPEMERKIDLSTEMHTIRPAREQIDMAVEQVSNMLRSGEREAFQVAIRKMLDYEALERRSIEAMAQVFTVEELEAMVAFYRQPVSRRISDKLEEYNKLIEPEVFKMLDSAMMEARTGGAE
jgi:hypothetical protein